MEHDVRFLAGTADHAAVDTSVATDKIVMGEITTLRGQIVLRQEWPIFGRLLVLALLLAHAALMATDHHSVAMGPPSASAAAVVRSVDLPATLGSRGHEQSSSREHRSDAPHPVLGDCPAQQAVLPLLLVLLILVAVAFTRGGTPSVATVLPPQRPARWLLPPPLHPSRRRALLQVFRN